VESGKMNSSEGKTLEDKEIEAVKIILDTIEKAKNIFFIFDGRAESLIVLDLLRRINDGKILIPVLFIDTSVEFKDIYQYIEKMRKLWGFRLITEKNEEVPKTFKFGMDKEKCCNIMKTDTLKNAIKKYKIDQLFAYYDEGIKIDKELLAKDIIIYPLQYFSNKDVWDYIQKYNIPYCSLYDKGYKNITCIPCADPLKSNNEQTIKEDEDEIKKRLKALGYI
jgi:phosphoadenosine phosphosulfate reductase